MGDRHRWCRRWQGIRKTALVRYCATEAIGRGARFPALRTSWTCRGTHHTLRSRVELFHAIAAPVQHGDGRCAAKACSIRPGMRLPTERGRRVLRCRTTRPPRLTASPYVARWTEEVSLQSAEIGSSFTPLGKY